MMIMYFSERPYIGLPEDEVVRRRSFFGLPNTYLDANHGAQLLNEYIDEKVYAEELGFDALALNEHHGTPFCMVAVMNVEASVLAKITKKAKIVLVGNPLPVVGNPLRLAEELAMIDMISGGRLVTGWIRGTGCETIFNSANPAYNREMLNEAHELIIKAWTQPGPFRFEGKHFHYRFVCPWVLPVQKPHPQIWIPGIFSPESVVFAARNRYPYIALSTGLESTIGMWNLYAQTAAEEGYQAGPECFGYQQKVFVAETEEQAEELGRKDMFGGNWMNYGRPEWMFPPGYNSKEVNRRMAQATTSLVRNVPIPTEFSIEDELRKYHGADYDAARKSEMLMVGTPKTVIPRLRRLMRIVRPGVLGFCQNDGPIGREARLTSMRLLAQEVIPALKETAKELGLQDPFARRIGERPLPPSGQPEPVASVELLNS